VEPHFAVSPDRLIRLVKAYEVQEAWGAFAAAAWGVLRKKIMPDEDSEAPQEGAMYLTPKGWETDKSRWNTSAPIRPQ
jgi:hypothetical protein